MGGSSQGKNEHKGMNKQSFSTNNYLVDTSVIIDHLRDNDKATSFLEKFSPCISTVTVAELIQGSRDKREQSQAIKTCASLSEISIDRKISEQAIELMEKFCLSHGLQFLDALIAATALTNQSILVSDNVKHFKFIEGLETVTHAQAFD